MGEDPANDSRVLDRGDELHPPGAPRSAQHVEVKGYIQLVSPIDPRLQIDIARRGAEFTPKPFQHPADAWPACHSLAYLTMWRAPAIGDVSVVSPLVNSHSIVAIVLSAIFLRDLERVSWRVALAAALIVGGVTLVMRG